MQQGGIETILIPGNQINKTLDLTVKWLSYWHSLKYLWLHTNHWRHEILVFHPHLCLDHKQSPQNAWVPVSHCISLEFSHSPSLYSTNRAHIKKNPMPNHYNRCSMRCQSYFLKSCFHFVIIIIIIYIYRKRKCFIKLSV